MTGGVNVKSIFIVNPVSGKGRSLKFIPLIEEYFVRNPGDYEIIRTERPGHAREIAARYHSEDDVIIYSVGGDGTANEILNGLNDGVGFCVFPAGTGNDLYKSIDTRKLSDEELVRGLLEGEDISIDYGVFNGPESS